MKETLTFRPDGTFKILQFTDIHYTLDDEADHRTVDMMRRLIAQEKPDFLITTGDTVYGEENYRYLPKALAPFTESGLPWSFVFGNHDVEFAGTHEGLFEEVLRLPGCVAFHDPTSMDGTGNHVLEVANQQGIVKWLIFGLDSGDYNPLKQVGGYGYVTRNQIRWYQDKIRELEEKTKDFSALTFQHIPLPEYEEMFRMETCYGVKRDGFGCPRVNTGFFQAMLEAGHTKGLFVGHDHINDFYGSLYGIILGYGRASGYGSYGAEDFPKGARAFILREDNLESFETYVCLDNGTVVKNPWKYQPLYRRDEG